MSEPESNPEKRIALFQRKEVRRVIHNNEWWFVVVDVVACTDRFQPIQPTISTKFASAIHL